MMTKRYFLVKMIFGLLLIACSNGSITSRSQSQLPSMKKINFQDNEDVPYQFAKLNRQVIGTGSSHVSHHKVSMRSAIINVVADLCPHGMLPLAFGLSQGGPTGIVPSLLLFTLFGSMSAYTMTSYAEMAEYTKSTNIGEVWSKLIGSNSSIIPNLTIFLLCFGGCVFYSAFIGDIFAAVASAIGIRGIISRRVLILSIISTFVLLPLCLLDDLSSLSFSSNLGVLGVLVTLLVHVVRYVDGSYASEGRFYKLLTSTQRPNFPSPKFNLFNVNLSILTLVNMLCVAFLAHYNAINYYNELEDRSGPKYTAAIRIGYGISLVVFISMMFVGYLLFGKTSQPLLLNNFHRTDDILATIARVATGIAITFAYPLMFAGLKGALKAMLSESLTTKKNPQSISMYEMIQTTILAAVTLIAFNFSEGDISFILGIVGSVFGCGAAYIVPGILRLYYIKSKKAINESSAVKDRLDSAINKTIIALGVIFGGLGVWETIRDALSGSSHH